jgi:multidrug resistance protein, MATE family
MHGTSGHLGTDFLGGASLGNVWMTVVSTFLFNSLGGTVNTLCSQALGARSHMLVGTWAQIGILVATCACVPVGVLWFFAEHVAYGLGFASNARLAGRYCRWSVIGLWPSVMYSVLNSYYQVRG